jgi:hypothetical protein
MSIVTPHRGVETERLIATETSMQGRLCPAYLDFLTSGMLAEVLLASPRSSLGG